MCDCFNPAFGCQNTINIMLCYVTLCYIKCPRRPTRGVATGGISVYIPPKSVTVLFTCGTLTHVLKLQWLVKTYTPPPQIKFLAIRHWDRPLTRTSASDSMFPRSDAATQVYVADSRMLSSIRTFLPIGMLSSCVSSSAPSRHLTNGIGDPMATHVMLTDPPGITSTFSGGIEKCGGTRRTEQSTYKHAV